MSKDRKKTHIVNDQSNMVILCKIYIQMNLHVQRKIVITFNNEARGGDVVEKLNGIPE